MLKKYHLKAYRRRTYRLSSKKRLQTVAQAVNFVQERGFVYFWPIKSVELPSLWVAVAGDRPVASKHDDPGHVTWGWKDQMLDQRQWYYAKVLRGKATLISLDATPYFYALSENYGDPEHDYLEQYERGHLSKSAKAIYEALLTEGILDTVTMRRVIRMTGKASNSPFDRGLAQLQRDFKILPVGVARTGGWRYSFIYDLVHRYYPDLPQIAQAITLPEARQWILEKYFSSVGAATLNQAVKLFQWKLKDVQSAIERLVSAGHLHGKTKIEGLQGVYYAVVGLK